MARFRTDLIVSAPIEAVWAFHADVGNLIKVIPMNMRPHVARLHERFEPGAEFIIRLGIGFWWVQWHGRIVEAELPRRFADEQIDGPFETFRHEHRFEPLPDGRTRIVEKLEYRLRHGPLGWLADILFVRWHIRGMFAFRRRILKRALGGA